MKKTRDELEARKLELQGERVTLRAYMADKEKNEDWHGVQDAASDLRELDIELRVLEWIASG